MKNKLLTLIATLLVAGSCAAQDFSRLIKSEKTGLVTITKIVEIDGQSKEDIYGKAKLWISKTYNNAQKVIQLDDKDGGVIVIKGIFEVSPAYVHYTFTIKIKDGKMKLDTDNIYSDSSSNNPNYGWGTAEEWTEGKANGYKQPKGSLKRLSDIANGTVDKIDSLYGSLEQAIKEPAAEEDW